MVYLFRKTSTFVKNRQINSWLIFFLLVYIIFVIKLITIQEINNSVFFAVYSLAVSFYILSRFAIAYFYEPESAKFGKNYQPSVSFAVPSKNEEKNIRETILKIAQTDYPKDKFDIIAVNDGSTDNTLGEMRKAKKRGRGGGRKS